MPGEIQNVPPQPIAFGKYTLLERISHGGMAEVFRARTQGTAGFERIVAIKLLLPQVADDADFVTMLIDEAKIAGQLSHANIAQIFDLGHVEGRYFIVQEYVPGRDLRAILHHLDDAHARLGVAQACHIILKICEALDYAHNKRDAQGQPLNLVHRDISPQNVIVSHEGEVKLIDFGIVKAEGRATRTLAGLVKGKFAYMSPEQIRGLPVDRRSDVFACGILLHELLTGVPLFKRGSEFETLQRARSAEIEPPSRLNRDVPPDLDRIVLRALARHVDDRYQAAVVMRDDLWEFVRASGQYHTRDQLSAWMRGMFGEPGPDLAAARSPSDLPEADLSRPLPLPPPAQPGPDLSDRPLYSDEDVDNMTVVDADLQSRLLGGVEDADTVAADADDALGGPPGAPQGGPVPALRDLAEAAQSQPERAVFLRGDESKLLERARRESRAVRGELEARPGRLGAGRPGGDAGDEEETTSSRDELADGSEPGPLAQSAAWFEPQTPTRERPAAQPPGPPGDDEIAVLDRDRPAPQGPPSLIQTLPPGMPGISPPMPHGMAQPMPQPMTAAPDARTIGPAQEMMAPQLQPPLHALPPHGPPPLTPPGFGPPPYPMPGEHGPPHGDFGPRPDLGPPMHGGMHGPPGHAPYGPPPMPPEAFGDAYADPFGPPPGWPGQPMQHGGPGPDLRAGRYFVIAAVVILASAVAVSLVLAVTGG